MIESLAQEDTDIRPEHIALIKQLIEREGQQETHTDPTSLVQ